MSLCSIKQKETIMKKTYINPAMEIVKVKTAALLAGSITDSTTGTKFDPTGTTTDMDGRSFDFDDEE